MAQTVFLPLFGRKNKAQACVAWGRSLGNLSAPT